MNEQRTIVDPHDGNDEKPCDGSFHPLPMVKTLTTNQGVVFVCERCSSHWFKTYLEINRERQND